MTKITLYGALFAAIPLVAQDTADKALTEKKLAEARTFTFINGQMLSGKPVKGSPYSAQAVNESTQTLADGNRIVHSTTSMLYRDSEGRERREESIGPIGNMANAPAKAIFISDPVEGASYSLDPTNKVARKNMQRVLTTEAGGRGPRAGFAVTSDRSTITVNTASGGEANAFFFTTERDSEKNAKVENLGTQMIEGVSAKGTRTTTTIPAGQMGNEQPLTIVSERWFSPDLGVTVMTTHSDPRMGTNTYKLTNIDRSEPPHTLFEVPAGYTVKGEGGEMRMRINPEEQQ